jgi:hypothetical protein
MEPEPQGVASFWCGPGGFKLDVKHGQFSKNGKKLITKLFFYSHLQQFS